jgi:hypothetical protein
MKKLLFGGQILFFCLFNIALLAAIIQFSGNAGPFAGFNYEKPVYNKVEEFDASLSRLTNIDKVIEYCDSLYVQQHGNTVAGKLGKDYTNLLSQVIRKRFYHGYSHYSSTDNYLSVLFSRATLDGYSAIVVPDDILKHPNAACSQQSIIMMEVLKKKGFKTRKVGFQGKTSGHFCLEVYFDGAWHFFDTNMEPDAELLNAHNHPDIATLVADKALLLNVYNRYPRAEIMDIFPTYTYGEINAFAAPRGILFQQTAKFLSYTIWIFFLAAFLFVRRKYLRLSAKQYVRNSRVSIPQPEKGTARSYYPGIAAQGS